jgi:hypothetical protein
MKIYICVYFEIQSRKFKFNLNRTRISGILHEDQNTFMIIFRSVLLRMRSVSDKFCRENQNIHFMIINFFYRAVYEIMWKNTE